MVHEEMLCERVSAVCACWPPEGKGLPGLTQHSSPPVSISISGFGEGTDDLANPAEDAADGAGKS